jgi:6-pyruvoyltetrahydropterin/6-carboxytetrahydropterin synthase
MQLTRVYRFSASHRLHAAALSAEQNTALYGKCNNPYGHGHDYVLHISVVGEVDEGTGRVVDVGALDRYVRERVLGPFDHRDMNSDINDFLEIVPTTENLAIAVERRLRSGWDTRFGRTQLKRVFIQETAKNSFELRTV